MKLSDPTQRHLLPLNKHEMDPILCVQVGLPIKVPHIPNFQSGLCDLISQSSWTQDWGRRVTPQAMWSPFSDTDRSLISLIWEVEQEKL